MPISAPHICTKPGCNTLITTGHRCTAHQYTKAPRKTDRKAYNRRAWRDRIRPQQLKRQPLCEHCIKQDIRTAAKHVDHIDGNAYNNQPENLQSLCVSCHSRKTAREDGGFGN